MQLVTVGLTGVLLITLRWIYFDHWTSLPRSPFLRRLHKQTVELFDSVTLVNIFIAIAIAAASLSMLRNGPPAIFEDEILRLINGIEFWLLALYYIICFCLSPFRPRSRMRFCILAMGGGFLSYILYLAFFFGHRVSVADGPAYEVVVKTCQDVYHYPSVYINYDYDNRNEEKKSYGQSLKDALPAIGGGFGGLILVLLLSRLLSVFFDIWERLEKHCKLLTQIIAFVVLSPYKTYKAILFTYSWLKRPANRPIRAFLIITIFYGHYVAGAAYSIYRLFHFRYRLRRFSQQEFEGNEWGFGQITAVVAYVPVGFDFFISFVGKLGDTHECGLGGLMEI